MKVVDPAFGRLLVIRLTVAVSNTGDDLDSLVEDIDADEDFIWRAPQDDDRKLFFEDGFVLLTKSHLSPEAIAKRLDLAQREGVEGWAVLGCDGAVAASPTMEPVAQALKGAGPWAFLWVETTDDNRDAILERVKGAIKDSRVAVHFRDGALIIASTEMTAGALRSRLRGPAATAEFWAAIDSRGEDEYGPENRPAARFERSTLEELLYKDGD